MPENDYLTRREAELLTTLGDETESVHLSAHKREHEHEAEAVRTAQTAHTERHTAEGQAVRVALDSVGRERVIHATAHIKEHEGHQREHALVEKYTTEIEALQKEARQLMRENIESRLATTNEWRDTVNDTLTTRASIEKVDAQNDRIVNLEKAGKVSEGRGIGQGAVVAYIVTAFGLISVVLGIVVVLSNVLTGTP